LGFSSPDRHQHQHPQTLFSYQTASTPQLHRRHGDCQYDLPWYRQLHFPNGLYALNHGPVRESTKSAMSLSVFGPLDRHRSRLYDPPAKRKGKGRGKQADRLTIASPALLCYNTPM
jgi:hypothetical protein